MPAALGSIPSPSRTVNLGPSSTCTGCILAVGVLVAVYVAEDRWRRRAATRRRISTSRSGVVICGCRRRPAVPRDHRLPALRRRPVARVQDLEGRPLDLGRGDRRRARGHRASPGAASTPHARRHATASCPGSCSRRRSAAGATGSTRSCSGSRPTLPWGLEIAPRNRPAGYAARRDVPPDVPLRVALLPARRHRAPRGSTSTAALKLGQTSRAVRRDLHRSARFLFENMRIDPAHEIAGCGSTRGSASSLFLFGVRLVRVARPPRPADAAPDESRRRRRHRRPSSADAVSEAARPVLPRRTTLVTDDHPTPTSADRGRPRRRRVARSTAPAKPRCARSTAINVEFDRSAVHRDHGPVGFGQVDAAALPRRARPGHVGPGLPRRRRDQRARTRSSSRCIRRDRIGFVFQAYNLDPDAQRAREHHAADGARRQEARPGVARPASSTPSASPTGSSTARPSCRVVSSSASRSPARCVSSPTSSSPTSRPGTSTRRRAPRSSPSCAQAVDDLGQTIVMVTHDPVAAGYADRVVFLADGEIVDEMLEPDGRRGARPDEEPRATDRMCEASRSRASSAQEAPLRAHRLAVMLGVAFISGTFVLTDDDHQRRSTTSSPTSTEHRRRVRGEERVQRRGLRRRRPRADRRRPAADRPQRRRASTGRRRPRCRATRMIVDKDGDASAATARARPTFGFGWIVDRTVELSSSATGEAPAAARTRS